MSGRRMSQGVWAQEFGEVPVSESPTVVQKAFGQSMEREGMKPSTGVLSEIERHRVVAYLTGVLDAMRGLRGLPAFWTTLGPAFRVRYEDFQGELAALRAVWRE